MAFRQLKSDSSKLIHKCILFATVKSNNLALFMIFFVKYNQRFKLVHMRGNKQTFEVDKSLLVLNLFLERNMGGSLILLVESI